MWKSPDLKKWEPLGLVWKIEDGTWQKEMHGAHNMFFTDKEGNWWATFFGNGARAPFRERPAILRIELDDESHVRPALQR